MRVDQEPDAPLSTALRAAVGAAWRDARCAAAACWARVAVAASPETHTQTMNSAVATHLPTSGLGEADLDAIKARARQALADVAALGPVVAAHAARELALLADLRQARAAHARLRWIVAHERDAACLALVTSEALEGWLRARGWSCREAGPNRSDWSRSLDAYAAWAAVSRQPAWRNYVCRVADALRDIHAADRAAPPALVLADVLPARGPWDAAGAEPDAKSGGA